jgi:hypothetical protein
MVLAGLQGCAPRGRTAQPPLTRKVAGASAGKGEGDTGVHGLP